MELWDWKPCISIGPIRFGMNRQVARNLLKTSYKEATDRNIQLDDFNYCKLYYNASNKVTCVKVLDNVQILYNKKIIFPGEINVIIDIITSFKVDSEKFLLYDYNKQIVTSYDPDDGLIEYITVARSNYFNAD